MSVDTGPAPSPEQTERLVREAVEKQFRKEYDLLKGSVGLATKIVAGAAALFLAIFTIFGWRTWGDIEKQAAATVNQRAEELIKKADSDTSLKDTLTNLLNRAVVNSNLTVQAKGDRNVIMLADHDWDRLRDWIKNEDLELQDFKDTLAVLNAQPDERKRSDANRLLSAMLYPPEKSPYRWIHNQPEKIVAILKNFKDKALGPAALEIVTSAALTDEIRASAAQYVRDVRFVEGVDKLLERYSELKDGLAKRQALVACAALRPDHAGVIAEVRKILSAKSTRPNTSTIVALLPLLSRSNISDEFQSLGKELLVYAARNGTYFSLSYPEAERSTIVKGSAASLVPSVMIWNYEANGYSVRNAGFDMQGFQNLGAYWDTLSDAANGGDINLVKALLMRNDDFTPMGQFPEYRTRLAGEAGAVLTLDQPGAPQRSVELQSLAVAVLEIFREAGSPEIRIIWRDTAGQRQTAKVTAFKGTGYQFTLVKVEPSPEAVGQGAAISNR